MQVPSLRTAVLFAAIFGAEHIGKFFRTFTRATYGYDRFRAEPFHVISRELP